VKRLFFGIYAMNEIETKVRSVLAQHGRLAQDANTLAADTDLPQAGMTSHASVNVMLGLEGAFDVEFPDHMLTRATFSSIASISAAIVQLQNS
jgi:acyl carrier protein